jgi:RHS repeat-associated protein
VNNIGQGGRLETLVTGSLQNLFYVYDQVGNISQITNSVAGETNTYGYDALDRLTGWTLNGVTESYDYDDDTGNLIDKNGLALDYPDANGSTPTHPHAVTSANASVYAYDANGNQTTRTFGSDHFDLVYDAENRLVEVQKNDATIALFTFDGDGKRVKSVMDGETILFAGGHYEKKGSTITKYYMAGASRVAMRKYTIPQNMEVEYLLGDHLGSTSLTTDANGVKISELRYKPWGETRYEWTDAPANTSPAYELVKYQFTGQYSYTAEFGLLFFNARWLDPVTGRFAQADTIVPTGTQGTQAWDRYAFVNNNPVRYTDPSGHMIVAGDGEGGAAYWALYHDDGPDTKDDEKYKEKCTDAGCTEFVSSALHNGGGLPNTDSWTPDLDCGSAWNKADLLYDHLIGLGYRPLTLSIMPKGAPASSMMTPDQIQQWFVDNKIPANSIAFYQLDTKNADGTGYTNAHVAITTGDLAVYNGAVTPAVTDFNGQGLGSHSIINTPTYTSNVGSTMPTPYTIVILVAP